MKHPSEWTDAECERFRQRHEGMRKEYKEAKEIIYRYGAGGAVCHNDNPIVQAHKLCDAAERIVEKYRDVKWLDEEQVKMVVCDNTQRQCKKIGCPHAIKHIRNEKCGTTCMEIDCIEVKG